MCSYVHLLEMYKAFVPSDPSLHNFVLQEFNSNNLHLKVFSHNAIIILLLPPKIIASSVCVNFKAGNFSC